jgi:hypothetical protein
VPLDEEKTVSRGKCQTPQNEDIVYVKDIRSAPDSSPAGKLELPHLSGEQLYQAVERTKPHLCQRFIFMTGHEADPKSDAFIRRVRGLMLWKPFHLADLLTAAQIIRRRTLLKRVAAATAMSS